MTVTTYKDIWPSGGCPKCGEDWKKADPPRYEGEEVAKHFGGDMVSVVSPEALVWTCPTCGYEYKTPTIDAYDPADDPRGWTRTGA